MQEDNYDTTSTHPIYSQNMQQENYYGRTENSYKNKGAYLQEGTNSRIYEEEQEEEKAPTEKSSSLSKHSILSNLVDSMVQFQNIKINLEMEINHLNLRKEMLNSVLEQKKRQVESIKAETKKIKLAGEKYKENTNLMTRELEFLNDMIFLNSNQTNEIDSKFRSK